MIIKVLVENTSISDKYRCEHGLSLYIETKHHKILFDLGQNNLFAENAKKMNIDLTEIDTVVISHGHDDHGGGLREFLSLNDKAKIYIHRRAFDKHYSLSDDSTYTYIGLDEELKNNDRIIFNSGYLKIDNELELISNVTGSELIPLTNKFLFKKITDTIVKDPFDHEQNLVIAEAENVVLIAGCAHRGIVNIIEHAVSIKGKLIDNVIGGFHLYSQSKGKTETLKLINCLADKLKNTTSMYYTCHCTGLEAYSVLKAVMNENIEYLATGSVVKI